MKITIGTRGSDLALWQAHFVRDRLVAAGCEVEIEVLVTRGDRIDDVPLQNVEGKAFFTKEIEDALLSGAVDVAVHSHKDLPVESPPGLAVVGVPERAPAAERLLVSPDAFDPKGGLLPLRRDARVGTSSPRRQAQLLALRPDLEILDLRGNVPTRVKKLADGNYDAILLAAAGLERLGLDVGDLITVDLQADLVVPAPGQGALAIQVRKEDARTTAVVERVLHDEDTARIVAAERRLLTLAGGGCNLALGATVDRVGASGTWRARVFFGPDAETPDRPARWAEATSEEDPVRAAEAAFERAKDPTAPRSGPLGNLRIALCGAGAFGSRFAERLAALGADIVFEEAVRCEDIGTSNLAARVEALGPGDALVVTSRRAAAYLEGIDVPTGVCVAAVGPTTARALHGADIRTDLVGGGGAFDLAGMLELKEGARVLHPGPEEVLGELDRGLEGSGAAVEHLPLYRTVQNEDFVRAEGVDVRIFQSPSAVRASLAHEREDASAGVERIAFGETTLRALEEAGLEGWAPKHGDREDIVRALFRRA
ncbi:MAG TPA: hydroxymethylbilane synthase, partial [Planctomycetes bacterium]|nr:hydroxymethylbilane synthase [Planctomycetota bacterium]